MSQNSVEEVEEENLENCSQETCLGEWANDDEQDDEGRLSESEKEALFARAKLLVHPEPLVFNFSQSPPRYDLDTFDTAKKCFFKDLEEAPKRDDWWFSLFKTPPSSNNAVEEQDAATSKVNCSPSSPRATP